MSIFAARILANHNKDYSVVKTNGRGNSPNFCIYALQFGIIGDFFEEMVGVLLVVHIATEVLHAVADDEIVGME